jgi:diguanylate cyclase (GGDEF)-like protein
MQTTPVKDEVDAHRVGDELDDLSHAFHFMIGSISEEHNKLEEQVQARMQELSETNARLSEEIEERKRMEKIIHESATTDYLTGLANRRKITGELDKLPSQNTHYTITLIDIDHFKQINDTFGHDAGDKVLRRFSRFLLHNIDSASILGRWGGEEFILLTKNSDAKQALKEAERLRKLINSESLANEVQSEPLTASFGIADNTEDNLAWENVIKRADIALYKAKKAGRNQSTVFEKETELS